MQFYARHIFFQAAWANAVCLPMMIGISENQNWESLEVHVQKHWMHHFPSINLQLHMAVFQLTHWWQLRWLPYPPPPSPPPFQCMWPLCWIRWKELVTVHEEGPAAVQMRELQVLWGKHDIKATQIDGSILATFLSTCSLHLKMLHWHTKHIFLSQNNPFITRYLSNNIL